MSAPYLIPWKGNQETSTPCKFSRMRYLRMGEHWLPEIASLGFAVLDFVAIVALLVTRQDKPQPKWPSFLNINSVLSIFTTLFRAAILFPVAEGITELKWVWFAQTRPLRDIDRFEAASKSPWGALKLLWKRSADVLTLAGAVIVVLALAVDAFSQQVLNFYSCHWPLRPIAILSCGPEDHHSSL